MIADLRSSKLSENVISLPGGKLRQEQFDSIVFGDEDRATS